MLTALNYSHQLLQETITIGETVIDGTIGNGYDTVLLAKLVGPTGRVLGFDVQRQAIEQTTARLEQADLTDRVVLYHQGHETVSQQLTPTQEIGGAIFNLGYLPQGDKQIITQANTTITAITGILPHLKIGGYLLVVVYHGHPGGALEKTALLEFMATLPQETYSVLSYQFINQKNHPPLLLAIQKKI